MGKKKALPLIEGVTIEAVAAEGKSLFHHDGRVVFVPYCVPGDVCDIQITRKKHSFMEGRVVRLVEKSELRAEPFCAHFGVCGGCRWQNLKYSEQLKAKQQQVYDQLTRIGKIELPPFNDILGSEKTVGYRNKLFRSPREAAALNRGDECQVFLKRDIYSVHLFLSCIA